MAKLQKVVKSVLLHEGMGDGADRFLLEPPAVDYAQNYRVDKQGSLQKRPGFESLTTVPGVSGETPQFLHAIKDSVYTFTKSGAKSWDGSTWKDIPIKGFLGTKEEAASTQGEAGLGCLQYQPLIDNDVVVGHIMAYAIDKQPTLDEDPNSSRSRDVAVEFYDADGSFVERWKYEDCHSPRLARLGESVGIFYIKGDFPLYYRRFSSANGLNSAPGGEVNLGVNVASGPQTFHFFGDSSTLTPPTTEPCTEECNRLGAAAWEQARYQVSSAQVGISFYFYVAVNEVALNGIGLLRVDVFGGVDGTTTVANRAGQEVLGVDATSEDVFVLYYEWARGELPNTESVIVRRLEPFGTMDEVEAIVVSFRSFGTGNEHGIVHPHGSVRSALDVAGQKHLMVAVCKTGLSIGSTDTEADVGNGYAANYSHLYNVRYPFGGVSYEKFDYTTPTSPVSLGTGSIRAHRLTTNIECDASGDFYVGVQQWVDYTTHIQNPSADPEYWQCRACTKPVTSAVCFMETADALDRDTLYPVATLDPGNSSHTDYGESETEVALGTLTIVGDSMYVSNRVKLSAESLTQFLGAKSSIWKRTSNIDSWSTCIGRVHKINMNEQRFAVATFGDGLVVNAAIPLWFDGRYFSELGPIDSPEILRVEDAAWDLLNSGEDLGVPRRPGFDKPDHGVEYPLWHAESAQPAGEFPAYTSLLGTPNDWRKMVVVVGFVDQNGNVHRSAPSSTAYVYNVVEGFNEGQFAAITGSAFGGSEVTIHITTPLSVLPKNVDYFAEVYCSRGPDDAPVLVAKSVLPRLSNVDRATITTRLNRNSESDQSTIIPITRTSPPVYTEGGDKAADPWPAMSKCVVTSTRLAGIDSVNPGRVIMSKLFEDYTAPEYNSDFAINLGDERTLTAIGKLDDKVIVFEPNDIHVIYGDGPDNRGQGNDFAVHYVATDVGCEDQESVIETPVGLMFYSKPRGFYLLDRNMQVQFVGSGIEDTARDIDIVDAQLVRDRAEVRFIVSGGPTERLGPDADTSAIDRPPRPVFTNVLPSNPALTYNYERQSWMTFSNYDGASSTIYQQRYTLLRNDWSVWQESRTRWDDPSGSNATDLWTPWVKLSEQVQGFVMLWRMKILGRYLSSLQDLGGGNYEAGDIQVEVYYDYESTPAQTKRYRVQDFAYNPFNDTPKRTERLQLTLEPNRGYCQAVKLRFTEIPSESMGEPISYALGRGFEISAVDFEMGTRQSLPMVAGGLRK